MSNDAFAWVKPQLLERKNLAKVLSNKDAEIANLKSGKAQLPDSYFEHPQGFVLAPDYNEAANQQFKGSELRNEVTGRSNSSRFVKVVTGKI